jgi:hypothetical protein
MVCKATPEIEVSLTPKGMTGILAEFGQSEINCTIHAVFYSTQYREL